LVGYSADKEARSKFEEEINLLDIEDVELDDARGISDDGEVMEVIFDPIRWVLWGTMGGFGGLIGSLVGCSAIPSMALGDTILGNVVGTAASLCLFKSRLRRRRMRLLKIDR
jgi:hypothetical protein